MQIEQGVDDRSRHFCLDEAEAKVILEFWRDLPKVDETELLLEGGKISCRRKLYKKGPSLIDCYILAAAKANRFSL